MSEIERLRSKLESCYTGAVYDVLSSRGVKDCVLPVEIVPITAGETIAGPAFTMTGHREDGLDKHETLLAWTGFLSRVPKDSVVVIQPNDLQLSHMGELSAETLKLRGVRGVVVDGGCRDTRFIEQLGFSVFCRYKTPADVGGRWIVDDLDCGIEIGGIQISPGDWVLGDADGVVIIPANLVEDVAAQAVEIMQTESLVRKAILDGADPQDAYLEHRKF